MMIENIDPLPMSLHVLGDLCKQQTQRFLQQFEPDNRYCFELWRRAVQDRVDDACTLIVDVYTGLVKHWVRSYLHTASDADIDDCVNFAFASMFQSLRKADRFARFDDLKPLVIYLRRCANSAALKHHRKNERYQSAALTDDDTKIVGPDKPSVEEDFEKKAAYALAKANLKSKKEEIFFDTYFELDLKPRQIYEMYPDEFQDVNEVYLVKQVLVERLRRVFKKEW